LSEEVSDEPTHILHNLNGKTETSSVKEMAVIIRKRKDPLEQLNG
jgi:hypothetical protein